MSDVFCYMRSIVDLIATLVWILRQLRGGVKIRPQDIAIAATTILCLCDFASMDGSC